jgi:predicted nucleic acid-binding protein
MPLPPAAGYPIQADDRSVAGNQGISRVTAGSTPAAAQRLNAGLSDSPPPTIGELTKWAEIRRWGVRRREELASWLSGVPVLPGDEPVAAIWGRLSAAAIQRGRPRLVNDMWVAACCLAYEVPLATLNKDYEDFKEHHGLRVVGAE